MNRIVCVICWFVVGAMACFGQTSAQNDTPGNAGPQAVPVLDGGAGPCSVAFTVTTVDGKPVQAAKVNVHIAYRFGGFHKLDLEASTNSDGRVKFTGLPSRVRRSELEFEVVKDDLLGRATVDPARECQATREIKLEKASKEEK